MNVLVTGGAGYIGSHAVRNLLRSGHSVVVVDDLRRGNLSLVEEACRDFPGMATWIDAAVEDHATMLSVLVAHEIDAVMHFAAFMEVGESVSFPLRYYANNFGGSLILLKACVDAGIKKFVFSSTAAVYGDPVEVPIREDSELAPINPYGRSKWMVEMALEDVRLAHGLGYTILRYFNVAGASADTALGELHEPETHLIPRVLESALSDSTVSIYGDDYPTPDGTCVRDYVHVEDLVDAHSLALAEVRPGVGATYNLGSERGFSVRDVIDTCESVTGCTIARSIRPRRPGDPAVLIADSSRIRDTLGWSPRYPDLASIVLHAWKWEQKKALARCGHGMPPPFLHRQTESDDIHSVHEASGPEPVAHG